MMKNTSLFKLSNAQNLYTDLQRANTEAAKKERFLQYLTVEFSVDQDAQRAISEMALGAEKFIANITRGGQSARGRADSQTETIIIEWEKDLNKTGQHAIEQLEEYLEGNWRSGLEYRYVLLTTDGIRWKRYAPDWSEVEFGEFDLGRNFKLKEVRSFTLNPSTFEEFPFFLDEVLFGSQPRHATLENIQVDFGETSSVFINSFASLRLAAKDLATQSELKVAYDEWRRFLSIAYGKFDDSPTMFLVHTYLSVFAKFIAYVVITKNEISDDMTVQGILDGKIFQKLNIERFVEDDFFHWVRGAPYFSVLQPMFREIRYALSSYEFTDVKEDILKGLYQELIDLETRHALGEYYTPDWLCERVIDELTIKSDSRFLDPACGSGSFLRAVITKMRMEYPEVGAAALAEQVVGIDIHPLSVLIAKSTLLLSLGGSVAESKRPVVLHIYLANSLLVPRGTADLFKKTFKLSVDNKEYALDLNGLNGTSDFDQLIDFCDNIVHRYSDKQPIEMTQFTAIASSVVPKGLAIEFKSQLYEIYRGMKLAHSSGRDSIWKFILQNSYKPIFLMNRFDFVVGNPPWLTYSSITNSEYQGLLRNLSDSYGVTPKAQANIPHLEIAAIFFAHAGNYFLKNNGAIAFVLPRSFLSADHHDNIRGGAVEGIKLTSIWDLNDVTNLFRVPSCVLFAIKTSDNLVNRQIPLSGISGFSFFGKLPKSQMHWSDAKLKLNEDPKTWFYSKLQKTRGNARSALTNESMINKSGINTYASKFSQGATIVPRNFYFIDIDQKNIPVGQDLRDRVVSIKTSDASDREAKIPWKGCIQSGRVEGKLLFRTAISKNLVPFAMVAPPLVVLPLQLDQHSARFKLLSSDELLVEGYTYGSDWFLETEKIWEDKKTENNKKQQISQRSYLDWQKKLSNQNPYAKYLVLYTSSASNACAAVVDRSEFDFPFIVDHKTYWCEFESLHEAHYVSAFINSDYANLNIKEFQSRGLFGPRDIHKLILKIPFPKFQKNNTEHHRLSVLSMQCSSLAAKYINTVDVSDLKIHALGVMRSHLKRQFTDELNEIDALVSKLSAGNVFAGKVTPKARRNQLSPSGSLFE